MARKPRSVGTFGIIGMDTGRFTDFSLALARLQIPKGWAIDGALNYDCAHACNFLAETFTGDYLLLMGDDHVFPSDIVQRLLARKVDIVAPLVTSRRVPFAPVARKDGAVPDLGEPGLIEVDETGTAGMLIHRRVFEALEPPYFQQGATDHGYLSDDVYFCRKARAAGFAIHLDTSLPISHLAVLEIAPHFDGDWTTRLSVGGKQIVSIKRG